MVQSDRYVVVDTNVIVYSITGSPRAADFEPYLVGRIGLLSFQTVGELRFIALRRDWGEVKRRELESKLKTMVVIPATDQITERWSVLMHDQMRLGSRIEVPDAWVAATALVYGCPIVTNDRKDFERIEGLTLFPES